MIPRSRILERMGSGIVFNKAAQRAVAGWRFTPYSVNGAAQTKRTRMRVAFTQ